MNKIFFNYLISFIDKYAGNKFKGACHFMLRQKVDKSVSYLKMYFFTEKVIFTGLEEQKCVIFKVKISIYYNFIGSHIVWFMNSMSVKLFNSNISKLPAL